jgi:Domain of unknown function (DUF4350)
MKWLAGLEKTDRRLLSACLVLVLVIVVLLAVFAPEEDEIDLVPSSYSTGSFGAKAAYLLLERSGYKVERWTQPLSQLSADPHTTLILAEPYPYDFGNSQSAVRRVLQQGGRVLVTGLRGALLLPQDEAESDPAMLEKECRATPNGFDPLADSGDVRIQPVGVWKQTDPRHHTAYLCNNKAVVVRYRYEKGQVIWWADALPLENSGIARGDNLGLFLTSVGPPGTRVVWDESLHGEGRSLWSFVQGTPVHLIWWQLGLVGVLLLVSYGRRSGPLRPDPIAPRASSLEFVRSLGSLYHRAGATNTAVTIAYLQLRRDLEKRAGIDAKLNAAQAAQAIARRFGYDVESLNKDLVASEDAAFGGALSEKRALALVQALNDHEQQVRKFSGREESLGRSIRAH